FRDSGRRLRLPPTVRSAGPGIIPNGSVARLSVRPWRVNTATTHTAARTIPAVHDRGSLLSYSSVGLLPAAEAHLEDGRRARLCGKGSWVAPPRAITLNQAYKEVARGPADGCGPGI